MFSQNNSGLMRNVVHIFCYRCDVNENVTGIDLIVLFAQWCDTLVECIPGDCALKCVYSKVVVSVAPTSTRRPFSSLNVSV